MKSEMVIPAVLILAGIGVLVTYGLQLRQKQTSAQPTPTPTATQVAASPASPGNIGNTGSGQSGVLVGGSAGDVVNVRSQSSTQSAIVQQAPINGRVQILGNARGADGNRWYYVRLDNSREGWVHGDLVRTTATAAPANPTTPRPSVQAILSSCQQRVTRQFPGTQVQVSQGAQNSDGSFMVNWQANTGAIGYCRVATNGNVVQYVNSSIAPRPTPPAATASPRTG